jgi:hypothetical protein
LASADLLEQHAVEPSTHVRGEDRVHVVMMLDNNVFVFSSTSQR